MGAIKKSPDAFRTISEVAEVLDIPAHVLRFWESRFAQIKPVKRGGGRRYYRPQDIDLLRGIQSLLYRDGLTIKGVQKVLREQGVKHVTGLGNEDEPPLARHPAKPKPATAKAEVAPAASPVTPPAVSETAPVSKTETVTEAEPAAPKPTPASPQDRRDFPHYTLPATPDAEEGEVQFDLFAQDHKQERRPFPPDPAAARRTDALRALIGKLEALRSKMAARE